MVDWDPQAFPMTHLCCMALVLGTHWYQKLSTSLLYYDEYVLILMQLPQLKKYKSPMQINEIHQLNDYHQTHSSKAIFDNIMMTVIALCYNIKAHLSEWVSD